MIFTDTIENWQDWGRLFQSIPAFTPLAEEICRREGLPWQDLSPLTPGTNGVFRCGDLVLKIFFPKESGLDPKADFSTELAASRQAMEWGIPLPRVIAQGMISDKYDFYYLVTEYSPGKEAGESRPARGFYPGTAGAACPLEPADLRAAPPGSQARRPDQ